jgi:hypothetical protein
LAEREQEPGAARELEGFLKRRRRHPIASLLVGFDSRVEQGTSVALFIGSANIGAQREVE